MRRAVPAIRDAGAEDLVLLPAVEAASDTLLAGMTGVLDSGLAWMTGVLHLGAGAPEPGADSLPLPPPASTAELASALHILVAGSPPVGFARLEEVDRQAHLEQLSVHSDAAGAGVGRALMEAALAWARARGYASMTLCTFARVPFNAPFYASCGFQTVPNPDGELAELRVHEKQLGLDALGERVAMRVRLGPAQ